MPQHLVADIGGTHARFALSDDGRALRAVTVLHCNAFATPLEALQTYLQNQGNPHIDGICLAVAAAVDAPTITLLNNHWSLRTEALASALNTPVTVINDFTAQALSLDFLAPADLHWLSDARPRGDRIRCILGPGTGFGLAVRLADGRVLPSEGGHISFAPGNEHEIALLRQLWRTYPRVSVERVLSGAGLSHLYTLNADDGAEPREAAAIHAGAAAGEAACLAAIKDFAAILGSVAGDAAIAHWARDGIYIAGGMVPRLWGLFDPTVLWQRFTDKGRLSAYCAEVPLAVIRAEQPGLLGALAALQTDGTSP